VLNIQQASIHTTIVAGRIHVIWGGGYMSYEEEDTCARHSTSKHTYTCICIRTRKRARTHAQTQILRVQILRVFKFFKKNRSCRHVKFCTFHKHAGDS
jgi:hypothetical protein